MNSQSKHILVIGVAGSGKSSIVESLKAQRIVAIDGDYDKHIAYWEHKKTSKRINDVFSIEGKAVDYHEWLWDLKTMKNFLEKSPNRVIVCGQANNRTDAYNLFGKIIVLTADDKTLIKRLINRTNNPFGKLASHRKQILLDNKNLLKEAKNKGFKIINTSNLDVEEVVNAILNSN